MSERDAAPDDALSDDTLTDGALPEATTEATTDDALIDLALDAKSRAYAPYSGYGVGCALIADGAVYTGANVENASYGLTLCAERVAMSTAVAAGARVVHRVAVATASQPPVAPCGMCLQTLIEFAPDPTAVRVLLINPDGSRRESTLAALLPLAFTRRELDAARGPTGAGASNTGNAPAGA